jgi:flagellar hook-length control protein FliK
VSIQTAPPKSARPDQASDQFGALVDSNLPANNTPSGSSDPSPAPRRADSSSQTADKNSARDTTPPDNRSDRNDPAGAPSTSADSAEARKPQADDKSGASKADDANATKSEAVGEQTDESTTDGTELSQQDTALNPSLNAAAAAIAVTIAPGDTAAPAADQAGGNSTGPLAIAAAALAASASTTAQVTSPAAATKADAGASPDQAAGAPVSAAKFAVENAATAAAATDPKQPVAPQTPAGDAALNGVADAATKPIPSKAAAPAPTKAAAPDLAGTPDAKANEPAPATPTATADAATQAHTTKPQAEGETAAKPIASDRGPSVQPNHEHNAAPAAPQVSASAPDANPQATSAVQPQFTAATTTTSATASTATLSVATPGASAVPVSGLPIEIAASVRSGKTRFEVSLDPADLGRIDVRIAVDRNGQVTSHLAVEKPETLSMLRQDASQLQRALDDAGLKTGSNGLQFSLRDQSSSGQNSPNDNGGNARRLIITEEEAAPAAAGRNYGRMLGSSNGVDIRV